MALSVALLSGHHRMREMPLSRTIPGLLDELATRFPDREALVGVGQRYSYASLREEVRAFAKGLHTLGVRRGDKVAILMGNKPQWIIADLAVCLLGGVMVAVNTWATSRELHHILAHSDSVMLVAVERYLKYDYFAMLEELEPHAKSLPLLRHVVHVGEGVYRSSISFSEVLERGRGVPDDAINAAAAEVGPKDVAYILYTSGSTSTPKGVQLQHYALIENMWHLGNRMHVTEHDRLWLAVSLFWGLGCENALFNLMTHGGCVVLQESFEPGEALRLIAEERCTIFYGMPNMVQAMYEHPHRRKFDISCMQRGGTLGTPEQLQRIVDMGVTRFSTIYGLTESYGNCTVCDADDPFDVKVATVGQPLPGVDLRITEPETGREQPRGTVGEIRLKGYVTIGYYKDEDRNREAFDANGYFRTGDLGYLDDANYLHFRGRLKEMIKTSGINVAPVEVEECLLRHPDVKLAFVTGVPDARRDEAIAAVVVPHEAADVSVIALIEHCRGELASYKVPRLMTFVREIDLPLTSTGKLQKNRLHEFFTREDRGKGQ